MVLPESERFSVTVTVIDTRGSDRVFRELPCGGQAAALSGSRSAGSGRVKRDFTRL